MIPLLDGEEYFWAVRMEIGKTQGPGDAIYMLGWRFESTFRFNTDSNDPSELGAVLANKAAAGVDVRIIMPTKWQLLYLLEDKTEAELRNENGSNFRDQLDRFGPHGNMLHADLLRKQQVPGGSSPLAGRILLDYSGEVTGTHHQKMVLVSRGQSAVGFIAGIDFLQDRLDNARHDSPLPRPNPARKVDEQTHKNAFPYYWHDAGARLEGPVVGELFFYFRARRDACSLFRDRHFQLKDGTAIPSLNPTNDWTELRSPQKTPLTSPPQKGVFLAANLPDYDVGGDSPIFHQPNPLLRLNPFKGKPVHTTGELYQKAINASKKYVYIEDQYFSAPSLHNVLLGAAQRGIKIIAVLGGFDDDTQNAVDPKVTDPTTLKLLGDLGSAAENIAILHVKNTVIHSKLMLVDDEFVVIGSSNFHDRSLTDAEDASELAERLRAVGQSKSTDSELSVAAVDDRADSSNFVVRLRIRLWAEHLRVDEWEPLVRKELSNLSTGLSIFRTSWGKAVSFDHGNTRFIPVLTK